MSMQQFTAVIERDAEPIVYWREFALAGSFIGLDRKATAGVS